MYKRIAFHELFLRVHVFLVIVVHTCYIHLAAKVNLKLYSLILAVFQFNKFGGVII